MKLKLHKCIILSANNLKQISTHLSYVIKPFQHIPLLIEFRSVKLLKWLFKHQIYLLMLSQHLVVQMLKYLLYRLLPLLQCLN